MLSRGKAREGKEGGRGATETVEVITFNGFTLENWLGAGATLLAATAAAALWEINELS